MKKCTFCNQDRSWLGSLASVKLKDGVIICFDCTEELRRIDVGSANKIMQLTSQQVKTILDSSTTYVGKSNNINRIHKQLKDLDIKITTKEINELPKILKDDEDIVYAVAGIYEKGLGVLISTTKRVIFIDKGILSLRIEDFGLDKITSIQYSSGILMADIKIIASSNSSVIENVGKNGAKVFCDKTRNLLSQPKQFQTVNNIVNNQIDIADQLEKFAKLRDNGIITQDEFDAQKKKLLQL